MMHSTASDSEPLESLLETIHIIYDSIYTCPSCWCSCRLQKTRGNVRGCAHGHCGNGHAHGYGCARGENGCDHVSDSLPEKPHGSVRG